MPAFRRFVFLPVAAATLLAVLLPAPLLAQVYTCENPDGSVAYRQTPCPEPRKPTVAASSDDPPTSLAANCSTARELAFNVARLMQGGLSQQQVVDQLGGIDSLNVAATAVVDHVLAFEGDADASAERIASLSETLCRGGSFGELQCDDLPAGFARTASGCAASQSGSRPVLRALPTAAPEPATSDERLAVRACREPIEQRIEAIDIELQRGITGVRAEQHLEELLGLTDQLRACANAANSAGE